MTGVPAGSGTINASAPGYVTQSQSITVAGDMNLAFSLSPATACPAIGFDALQTAGAPFSTETECGFVVRSTAGNWMAVTGYGNPAPSVQFLSPAGMTTTGEIFVSSSGGSLFKFISVDIQSSLTEIPYLITGLAGSRTVFTIQNTQGNTFSNFVTISNLQPAMQIDGLKIDLVNSGPACCANPMGLDNIRLSF